MANGNQLPEGFVLDAAPQGQAAGLPEGFVMDQPVTGEPSQAPLNDPRETMPVQPQPTEQKPMAQMVHEKLNEGILNIPGAPEALETLAGLSRGNINLLDFFGPEPINAALELAGIEARIPTAAEITEPAIRGHFMEPGLAKDIIRTGTELIGPGVATGAAMRGAAKGVPALQTASQQTMGQAVTKQMGASTPAQDVALSAVAGAGAELGEETGLPGAELVGAFLAPVGAVAGQKAVSGLIGAGKAGWQALTNTFAGMSDDGASTLLAEAMIREGLSPDDVVKRLTQLGPEGMPADIGDNFSRLLRTAANKIPRIEGMARESFKARQSGQGGRILTAFDDASGTSSLNVDDEIARLNTVLKPKISALYKEASSQGIRISERLQKMLAGKNSLGRAAKRAEKRLIDKRAAGDEISHIDIIDATKQELDDEIGMLLRQGKNNKARDLIRLKNVMVDEADASIPVYKQARDMFAGKASLENAAGSGQDFLKLKPRDVRELTKTMSVSEKKLFKMGAKQAILDKIDSLQTNANAVKRLFGKNGDVKKLKSLFDNNKSYKQFADTLEREADFILTKNALGNSTTAKQLLDTGSAVEVLGQAANSVRSPTQAMSTIGRIITGMGKAQNSEQYVKSIEQAGYILLVKGIEPARITELLKKGSAKLIAGELKRALKKPTRWGFGVASTVGGVSELDRTAPPPAQP